MHFLNGARVSKKFLFTHEGDFPDSTLRGNAEFGDNNQVAVALVIYLFLARKNNRRENWLVGLLI